jgi:predicted MFS family arabinose efflux permease
MAAGVWFGIIDLLIINSLIWGCGAAFYWVGSDAEISERVLGENRAEAFGRREAASAQGSVFGAFIGFFLLFEFQEVVPFLFFAAMNIIGGVIVLTPRVKPIKREKPTLSKDFQAAIAVGVVALVIAAAIDAFGMALLAPFVELFILERFTNDIILVALVYLPPGIISSIVSGQVGRYADKSNKVMIVAFASFVGFLTNVFLVLAPNIIWLAVIFSVQNVIGVAGHTVMASVFGTAYEGRAEEGFGLFGGVLAFARFIAPIIGGMIWITVNPAAPFLLVGSTELLLVPVYYLGMKKYQAALNEKAIESPEHA